MRGDLCLIFPANKEIKGRDTERKKRQHREGEEPKEKPCAKIDDQAEKGYREQQQTAVVKPFPYSRQDRISKRLPSPYRSRRSQGYIKIKVPSPVDRGECSPQNGADHKRCGDDHREDAHRPTQLLFPECVGDQDRTVGDDN